MALDWKELSGRVLVTDGAWGTELQQRGLPGGMCPELWNVENPDAVEAVARGYVEAGSDVIIANTFGGHPLTLAGHDLTDRLTELIEAGTAISRRAAGGAAMVFASMGPTGKIVMMGEVPEEEIYNGFAEMARAIERGGADAVVAETMTEIAEVALAVRAIRENTELPVVVSMTYDSGPDKTATMMGASPADAVAALSELGVSSFGANCGVGPADYVNVAKLYRQATDAPIWIKANAGLPEMVDGTPRFPMGPDEFAGYVPALVDAGATFVGGCCGTTPEHIAAVRKTVDSLTG